MGLQSPVNEDGSGTSARLDAQSDRCKLLHNSFHERGTRSPECLYAVLNGNLSDRLTNLNADGTVTMGYDAIKLGLFNCSSIYVEAARTLAKCLDWRRELDFPSDAEIYEANTTRSEGRNLFSCNPTIDYSPIVISFAPKVLTGPSFCTRSTAAPCTTKTPPEIRSGVPGVIRPSL